MKYQIILSSLVLGLAASAADTNQVAQPAADTAVIQRGKYLVERVAMCGECHTPRDEQGHLDHAHWLQGNVLDYKPTNSRPFTPIAPPIASLPSYATDDLAVRFLETGQTANGKPAQPPMPQFRLTHDDAIAVVAYLRSLKLITDE
ncbi:MAG: c-type cytochrome [Verrucomicrobiota bacterium]|jgi:mono/diheme cytochrome c family protein